MNGLHDLPVWRMTQRRGESYRPIAPSFQDRMQATTAPIGDVMLSEHSCLENDLANHTLRISLKISIDKHPSAKRLEVESEAREADHARFKVPTIVLHSRFRESALEMSSTTINLAFESSTNYLDDMELHDPRQEYMRKTEEFLTR